MYLHAAFHSSRVDIVLREGSDLTFSNSLIIHQAKTKEISTGGLKM